MSQQIDQTLDITQTIKTYLLSRVLLQVLLVIGVVAFFSGNTYGQPGGILLCGSVIDENQQGVKQALVKLNNSSTETQRFTESEVEGRYFFVFLEPGDYTIFVEKKGYQDSEKFEFIISLSESGSFTLPPIVLKNILSSEQAIETYYFGVFLNIPRNSIFQDKSKYVQKTKSDCKWASARIRVKSAR